MEPTSQSTEDQKERIQRFREQLASRRRQAKRKSQAEDAPTTEWQRLNELLDSMSKPVVDPERERLVREKEGRVREKEGRLREREEERRRMIREGTMEGFAADLLPNKQNWDWNDDNKNTINNNNNNNNNINNVGRGFERTVVTEQVIEVVSPAESEDGGAASGFGSEASAPAPVPKRHAPPSPPPPAKTTSFAEDQAHHNQNKKKTLAATTSTNIPPSPTKKSPGHVNLKGTPFGGRNFSYAHAHSYPQDVYPSTAPHKSASPTNASANTAAAATASASGSGAAAAAAATPGPSKRPATAPSATPVHDRLLEEGRARELRLAQQRALASQAVDFTPRLSAKARALVRTEPVADSLARQAREHHERMEKLRREKELEEERQATFKPQVDPHTVALAQGYVSQGPVAERLFKAYRQTLQKREALKKKADEKELAGFTAKPRISEKAQKITRSLDDMEKWREERDRRRRDLLSDREREETRECTFKPMLAESTERLAKRIGRAERVEDSLLAKHELAKQKREELIRRREEAEKEAMIPKLNPHSANYVRVGSVTDSYWANQSLEHHHSQQQQLQLQLQQQHFTAKPTINPKSQALVRDRPVEEILLEKHREAMDRKAELLRQRHEEQLKAQTQPKMSAVSQVLVHLVEKRTKETSHDRLLKTPTEARDKVREAVRAQEEKELTFHPQISETSKKLVEASTNHGASVDRFEVLHHKAEEYRQDRESKRARAEAERLKECTFKPNSRPADKRSKDITHHSELGELDLVTRSYEWARRREGYLEQQRAIKESQELAECTFAPHTTAAAAVTSPTKSVKSRPVSAPQRQQTQQTQPRQQQQQQQQQAMTPLQLALARQRSQQQQKQPGAHLTYARTTATTTTTTTVQQQQQQQGTTEASDEDDVALKLLFDYQAKATH
jgi:hypothetical protein